MRISEFSQSTFNRELSIQSTMEEPTILCPKCKSQIRLTESLAAPLIESTRLEYEKRITDQAEQAELKLKQERAAIAADEQRKARVLLDGELEQRSKELAELQDLLKVRDEKLQAAQQMQADLLRKQRELDEERREMQLTIEQRVQESVVETREKAKKEAQEELNTQLAQRDKAIESLKTEMDQASARFQQTLSEKEDQVTKRELALKAEQATLEKSKQDLETQFAERLAKERAQIASEESRKAKMLLDGELESSNKQLDELKELLKVREEKLHEAQQKQAELIRKERALEDEKRELDLTVEKRIQESLSETREKAKKEAEDSLKMRIAEREHTIAAMQKQIEELKQRAEQGSQQLQGEVLEVELENVLSAKFPTDTIKPVPKGEHGGDLIHCVMGSLAQPCGTILWETKRTKTWSDGWLVKLRDDQRAAKAEIAIIVSHALPKHIESFDFVDGVWVTSPRHFVPVALALRQSLIELASVRTASEGQQTKTEMIYQYMTGPRFRHRIQAIVEAFKTMEEDLQKERKAITRQWSKRQEQIERVMQATVGLYGDLQGIAGKNLQEIEGLEFPLIEDETDD